MKKESKLVLFSSEMMGHRLKSRQNNSQEKFPLESQAENTE